MTPPEHDLDSIWHGLASPVRRGILDLLKRHPRTTTEVWAAFRADGLSRFAVMQHLRVLEAAGLVARRRSGRATINVLDPRPLRRLYRAWMREYLTLVPAPILRFTSLPANWPGRRRPGR
jgi:DNA-binding transcriptional ArsR family regulator